MIKEVNVILKASDGSEMVVQFVRGGAVYVESGLSFSPDEKSLVNRSIDFVNDAAIYMTGDKESVER